LTNTTYRKNGLRFTERAADLSIWNLCGNRRSVIKPKCLNFITTKLRFCAVTTISSSSAANTGPAPVIFANANEIDDRVNNL